MRQYPFHMTQIAKSKVTHLSGSHDPGRQEISQPMQVLCGAKVEVDSGYWVACHQLTVNPNSFYHNLHSSKIVLHRHVCR